MNHPFATSAHTHSDIFGFNAFACGYVQCIYLPIVCFVRPCIINNVVVVCNRNTTGKTLKLLGRSGLVL